MPLSVEGHGPKGPVVCGKRNGHGRGSPSNLGFPHAKKKKKKGSQIKSMEQPPTSVKRKWKILF